MIDQQPQSDVDFLASDTADRTASISHFLGVLSESRWLVAGIAAGIFAIGVFYAFLSTPIYQADTVLHVLTQQSGGLSGIEMLSTLIQGSAVPTDTEIQLLQTRAVLAPVVDKLHLNIRVVERQKLPIIGPLIGGTCRTPARVSAFDVPREMQGRAFSVSAGAGGAYRLVDPNNETILEGHVGTAAAGRINGDSGPAIVRLRIDSIAQCAQQFDLVEIPMDQAVASLQSQLSIQEVGLQTGVIRVSMKGASPGLLAAELNAVADTNVQENVRQNASQAALQLGFLNAQIPDVANQLHTAQAKLADFLSSNPTLAALSQSAQYLVTEASALDERIGPLQAETVEAQASLGARNPQLAVMGAQLQALKSQRSELLSGIAKLPKDQQTLVRLQSDVTTSDSLYTAMLNQVQTLQVAKAGTVGDIVVVDPAVVPSRPVEPNRPLVVLVGLALGLFLGVGAAFGRRALRQGIEDPEVLDERLGLPVFAVLPHSEMQRRMDRRRAAGQPGTSNLLAAIEKDDQTVEALRSLRTALRLALPNGGKGVICMTSLSPNEGKSFVASNLGYLFAQGGLRVLIVDADLRRGHLHRSFGWTRGRGLSELMRGEISIEEAVRETPLQGLHLMTTGALPADAATLLVHCDIGDLLDRLRASYDLVVMDVPPVLAVSDAYIIARHATVNILLLKHGLHGLGQVRLVLKQFARQGIKVDGSVLNDVSAAAQRYAYRGYGYQYTYRYK